MASFSSELLLCNHYGSLLSPAAAIGDSYNIKTVKEQSTSAPEITMPSAAFHGPHEATMSVHALAVLGLTAAEYSTPYVVQEYLDKTVNYKALPVKINEKSARGVCLRKWHTGDTTINLISVMGDGGDHGSGRDNNGAVRWSKRHSAGGFPFGGGQDLERYRGRNDSHPWQQYQSESSDERQPVKEARFDGLDVHISEHEEQRLDEYGASQGASKKQGERLQRQPSTHVSGTRRRYERQQQNRGFHCTGGHHVGGYSTMEANQRADSIGQTDWPVQPGDSQPGMFLPQISDHKLGVNLDRAKLGGRHEALGSHPAGKPRSDRGTGFGDDE